MSILITREIYVKQQGKLIGLFYYLGRNPRFPALLCSKNRDFMKTQFFFILADNKICLTLLGDIMKEKHYAYKITNESAGLVCTYSEIEENKMLDLLKEVNNKNSKGIYWIFRQLNNQPKEQLCIIDCNHGRIYYHYSGEVEDIANTIKKLSKSLT